MTAVDDGPLFSYSEKKCRDTTWYSFKIRGSRSHPVPEVPSADFVDEDAVLLSFPHVAFPRYDADGVFIGGLFFGDVSFAPPCTGHHRRRVIISPYPCRDSPPRHTFFLTQFDDFKDFCPVKSALGILPPYEWGGGLPTRGRCLSSTLYPRPDIGIHDGVSSCRLIEDLACTMEMYDPTVLVDGRHHGRCVSFDLPLYTADEVESVTGIYSTSPFSKSPKSVEVVYEHVDTDFPFASEIGVLLTEKSGTPSRYSAVCHAHVVARTVVVCNKHLCPRPEDDHDYAYVLFYDVLYSIEV